MRHRRLRSALPAAALGLALFTAGCGGAEAADNGPTTAPAQDRITISPDTAATPFALQKGTYRLNWTTTDCSSITVSISGDTGYAKSKVSGVPNFSWILTSVTDGTYTVAMDPSCATWTINLEKIGG